MPIGLHLELNDRRKLHPVSDGIDFLGYIVRPHYRLVRRRVVGALWERLSGAEQRLRDAGMLTHPNGRQVFPSVWPVLASVRASLNSYLEHLHHASAHRLRQRIRHRFPWVAEYFWWHEHRVTFRCPLPRHALRYRQQRMWFQGHFPEHVVVIQRGGWWEVVGQGLFPSQAVPPSRLAAVKEILWQSPVSVVWVHETGRRVSRIAERAVAVRWTWCPDTHV